MLIVKQDKNRDEQKEGQIFVELSKYRDVMNINDCDRLGYWCDKAHLSHFIMECAKCFTENELKNILKMNKETINIKKENVMAAYNAASDEIKNTLEILFGKETFKPQNVMERVKTFEDACNELGIDADKWIQDRTELELEPDVIAYMKLRIITAALNEGWKPQFTEDEWRYFPWFMLYLKEELEEMDEDERSRVVGRANNNAVANGGLAVANANSASSSSDTYSGSRLAFKSEELAVYCGKQFIDIWVDFICA